MLSDVLPQRSRLRRIEREAAPLTPRASWRTVTLQLGHVVSLSISSTVTGLRRNVDRDLALNLAGGSPNRLLDAVLQGVADELLAPVQMQLGEDVADVVLDGLLGDVQLGADLLVGMAPGHEL